MSSCLKRSTRLLIDAWSALLGVVCLIGMSEVYLDRLYEVKVLYILNPKRTHLLFSVVCQYHLFCLEYFGCRRVNQHLKFGFPENSVHRVSVQVVGYGLDVAGYFSAQLLAYRYWSSFVGPSSCGLADLQVSVYNDHLISPLLHIRGLNPSRRLLRFLLIAPSPCCVDDSFHLP